jgi:NAD(P)-dependent dehydrogenase (short-subunit alcohol dehydrogenase family)
LSLRPCRTCPTHSEGVSQFIADLARTQGKSESEVEADFFATIRPPSLIKRFAEVEEVVSLVINGCPQQTSATTGAALRVDGGFVRAII